MPKIETLTLHSVNPKVQCRFYTEVLGMKLLADNTVGYGIDETSICFVQAETSYQGQAHDLYWKIALSVPNIDLAYQQLTERGIQVSIPKQFQDVGFLAHFVDPEGFTIELIDHFFEGQREKQILDREKLGGGAHFSLITLRATDMSIIRRMSEIWKMKPLAIQLVESYGFTLYFFAYTSEDPPYPDLYSVNNREWLYQRKYTVLEIQHVHDSCQASINNSPCYGGIMISGLPEFLKDSDLLIQGS